MSSLTCFGVGRLCVYIGLFDSGVILISNDPLLPESRRYRVKKHGIEQVFFQRVLPHYPPKTDLHQPNFFEKIFLMCSFCSHQVVCGFLTLVAPRKIKKPKPELDINRRRQVK